MSVDRKKAACRMLSIVHAEHLKMRHTFGRILPAVSALMTLLLVLSFSGGQYFAVSAWNWWYTMMMPGMLAVLCYLGMKREKKMHCFHLFSSHISPAACLTGKMVYYAAGLCLGNMLLFSGTWAAAACWGTYIPMTDGLAAVVLLSVCYLWEIPFFMMAGARFGIFVSIFSCMVLTLGGTAFLAGTDLWWLCPAAVPVRMMCPVLGILPNGLLVPADSPLRDTGVILPGIAVCLAWFAALHRLMVSGFREMGGE